MIYPGNGSVSQVIIISYTLSFYFSCVLYLQYQSVVYIHKYVISVLVVICVKVKITSPVNQFNM